MDKQYIYSNIEFGKFGLEKQQKKGQKQPHDWFFYSSGKHLLYISRLEAVYIQDDNISKFDLETEFKNSNKDFKEWLNSKTKKNLNSKKSGVYRLFEEPKDIKVEEEILKLNKINKKQIVWEMIINPGDFGVENFMVDKNEWSDLLNVHLRKLLKSNHLDPENITGHWVIHANTDYPHIHLSFWEKNPNTQTKKPTLQYKQKGWFSKISIQNFNNVLSSEILYQKEYRKLNKTKAKTWDLRKHLKVITTSENIDDVSISKEVMQIRSYMFNKDNKTYKKADEYIKESVWKIFDYIKQSNPKINEEYEKYIAEINKFKEEEFVSDFNNSLKNNFINKENDEFEKQLGNLIIKLCLSENVPNSQKPLNNFQKVFQQKQAINFKRIIDSWNWEANGIQFKNKIEALRSYRKNIKTGY